jgi:hypothetical protein
LLQSITFVTGIRALLLLVAGLYALSLVTRPGAIEQASHDPAILDTRA